MLNRLAYTQVWVHDQDEALVDDGLRPLAEKRASGKIVVDLAA